MSSADESSSAYRRRAVEYVDAERMEQLFASESAWAKITSGEWTSIRVLEKFDDSNSFYGHLSEYVKHYDIDRHHRATTHRVFHPVTGAVPHHHGKDITIDGVTYATIKLRDDT